MSDKMLAAFGSHWDVGARAWVDDGTNDAGLTIMAVDAGIEIIVGYRSAAEIRTMSLDEVKLLRDCLNTFLLEHDV